MTRQRAQCPWEEGQGWKPCSLWRLLRNPAEEPELLSCASTLAEWHFNMCQGKAEREAAKPHYSHTPILQQKWTCHSGHKHLGTSLSVSRAQIGISFYAAEALIFLHLPTKHPSNTPASTPKPRSHSSLQTEHKSFPGASTGSYADGFLYFVTLMYLESV